MAKSCKGLANELVKCVSDSSCVKVENRSYLRTKRICGFERNMFNCKGDQGQWKQGTTRVRLCATDSTC